MTKEAMKLALEALEVATTPLAKDRQEVLRAQSALREALAEQPVQQEPVSDRENAIIRFALHQFMSNAYSHMNAAAQDKDSRHYTVSAVEKFAKDAKDAEALLSRLQFKAPQPPQRTWVGLTDEEIERCMKQAYATVQGRNLEHAFARAIEAAHGIYAPTELKEKNT